MKLLKNVNDCRRDLMELDVECGYHLSSTGWSVGPCFTAHRKTSARAMDRTSQTWEQGVAGQPVIEYDVMAKLGGIGMPENGFNWHHRPKPPTSDELIRATRRYYEFTIDVFGVDRCMFESNFPVDIVFCSFNVPWNSFWCLIADKPADGKAKLDTATRAYRR